MSKNTVTSSEIFVTRNVLENSNIPHVLRSIGKVEGKGENDRLNSSLINGFYTLHSLSYMSHKGDKITLAEQIIREPDPNLDDVVVSLTYLGDGPFNHPIEVLLDEKSKPKYIKIRWKGEDNVDL